MQAKEVEKYDAMKQFLFSGLWPLGLLVAVGSHEEMARLGGS